ncbi:MAG TPA: Uma2 family endonuclease [Acidimicrobiales bacterium]|nr:Uma2 family endonuclease [Acidimicrobiales bacterium]
MAAPRHVTHRGVEGGAVLVVEIGSPGDETDAKIPFYDRFGVAELLIVDRDTATVELLRRSTGGLVPGPIDEEGWRTCSLGVGFGAAPPNVLEVRLPGGDVERC